MKGQSDKDNISYPRIRKFGLLKAVILMFAVSLLMYGGLGLTITPPAA